MYLSTHLIHTYIFAIEGMHQLTFFKRSLTDKPNPETSIFLVSFTQGRLTINPEALDLLKSIKKPVAVVGICGPHRSGKSYFMSRIMGSDNEFTVNNHVGKPCTRGIWMSTSVLAVEEYAVILLDTEGIGDASEEALSMDGKMHYLILTTLLCSYLIYNIKGILTDSDMR